jgi:hypothetical protein
MLSPTPYATPPVVATGDYSVGGTFARTSTPAAGAFAATSSAPLTPAKKRSVGPIVAGLCIVVALAVAAAILIPRLTAGEGGGGETTPPVSQPTTSTANPCPDQTADTTEYIHPNDGLVHGGRLAFPRLLGMWGSPETDTRVPFGRDVQAQSYLLHYRYDGDYSWVASVLVAELYAGDGFYSPSEGAEIVTRCVLGTFYSDAVVTRNDTRNEAYSIDGVDGWIIQTTLSFEIENLPTTSEEVTIIVMATSDMTSSLFYASVPMDSPESVFADVRYVIDSLRISE